MNLKPKHIFTITYPFFYCWMFSKEWMPELATLILIIWLLEVGKLIFYSEKYFDLICRDEQRNMSGSPETESISIDKKENK